MRRILLALALCLAAPAAAFAQASPDALPPVEATPATPSGRGEIVFRPVRVAMADAAATDRVLVLFIHAKWCGWCRKMESLAFRDPAVLAMADGFVWAELDIDEEPEAAAVLGVRAVPALALMNPRGQLLDLRLGYVGPAEVLAMLRRFAGAADAPDAATQQAQAVEALVAQLDASRDPAGVGVATADALDFLAAAPRGLREPVVHAVLAKGRAALPALVEALAGEGLARRAAAADLLRTAAPTAPAFDPFATAEERASAVESCRRWLAELRSAPSTP